MDLIIKDKYLSEKALDGLKRLRASDVDITQLINDYLESFSGEEITQTAA